LKKLKSQFLAVFQSFGFGQLLAIFGQFWADSAALAVVESMPKFGLKS
jgi:hypothetical protein